jgi:hypothetical protein
MDSVSTKSGLRPDRERRRAWKARLCWLSRLPAEWASCSTRTDGRHQPQGSLAPLLASLVGRLAVGALGDFLKMIPGIGTVAGGSLNVAVAVGLTRFLGEALLAWLIGRFEVGATLYCRRDQGVSGIWMAPRGPENLLSGDGPAERISMCPSPPDDLSSHECSDRRRPRYHPNPRRTYRMASPQSTAALTWVPLVLNGEFLSFHHTKGGGNSETLEAAASDTKSP